jgi:hypothetical protein
MRTANVVRMLKTKVSERTTAKGLSGQVDDALVVDVISAYRKQLQMALGRIRKGCSGHFLVDDQRVVVA